MIFNFILIFDNVKCRDKKVFLNFNQSSRTHDLYCKFYFVIMYRSSRLNNLDTTLLLCNCNFNIQFLNCLK